MWHGSVGFHRREEGVVVIVDCGCGLCAGDGGHVEAGAQRQVELLHVGRGGSSKQGHFAPGYGLERVVEVGAARFYLYKCDFVAA